MKIKTQYESLDSLFHKLSKEKTFNQGNETLESDFIIIDDKIRETARDIRLDIFNRYIRYNNLINFSLFVVILFFGLLLTFWIVFLFRKILIPLKNIEVNMRKISEGDHELRLPISSDDEIGHLIGSFNDMTGRVVSREKYLIQLNNTLKRQNVELDEFTYIASHDLQEPLRKLISFSALLEQDVDTELNDSAKADLEYITDAASRMQTLIQDLLTFSRTGKSVVNKETIDMNALVSNVLNLFDDKIIQKKVKLINCTLPETMGDPVLISLIYQNLIQNAIKFNNNENPVIEITYDKVNGNNVFGVRDNGIGIKKEYQTQIFKPFKRLHSRYDFPGTGIGLAICSKIIEKHKGEI
ncbi:MAG: HAMP domain-containing protein, partial [Candidatus Cloacimonetes bacterium]|nr:HAMP domain-containing protein [Candidatus Cloacimonadota bacterium]